MNSILGPVLAIVATVALLLLRELFLAVGKRDRDPYGAADHPPVPGSDFQRKHSLFADPIREFEEPLQQATPIAVDEFLTDLRAKAQEQSPWSLTRNGSTTEFGRTQSNRKDTAEDL